MKRKLKAGSTSQTIPIFVQDASSTIGAGLGGLTYQTSGLTAKFRRQGQSAWTTVSLVAATLGTWTSGGLVADGGVAGCYELSIPDAALAAGATWVTIQLSGAANMLPVLIEIELDAIDYQTSVASAASVAAIPTATQTADAVLSRGVSNMEATADAKSLATIVLATANKANTKDHEGYLTVYRTDGVTEHVRISISTDVNAAPIDGIG